MNSPKRIKEIAKLIPPRAYVADVGADHGYLEAVLAFDKPEVQVVAIENKVGPFEILKSRLSTLKNMKASLSDGLDEISPKVNVVVLAGMGGQNIKDILSRNIQKLKHITKIIIEPHRDEAMIRKFILDLNYKVEAEKIVLENDKFYVITSFVKNHLRKRHEYSEDEIEFGYRIYNDSLWEKFVEATVKKIDETILKIQNVKGEEEHCKQLLNKKERMLKYGKD